MHKTLNYILLGVLIVTVGIIYYVWPDVPFHIEDCVAEGCPEDQLCLVSAEGSICVERQFYDEFWTIYNMYNYDACKLTIMGDTGISFFGMTLKECDFLKWSCTNQERYNTECLWLNETDECICKAMPYEGKLYGKNIAVVS